MNSRKSILTVLVRARAASVVAIGASLAAASPLLAAGDGGEAKFLLPSVVWAIGAFLIVLFVLTKKLLPPITAAMDQRAREIRESLDAAEKARADTEEMVARHRADMEKARVEAAALVDAGRADAQRLKESIVAGAEKQAQEITARSLRQIEQAKHGAVDALRQQAAQLSLDIANHLIRKNLTLEDQKQLIDERIREFPAA